MVDTATPVCEFGWHAPPFDLPGIDGRNWRLEDVAGAGGLLVMFICNHCPFVRAIADRLARDTAELKNHGVGSVAIMSNDAAAYPEDSFDNMKLFAAEHGFSFPYVTDESQQVARAYGAVCTPDFFGFNAKLELQYRGRLDPSGRAPAPSDAPRELFDAMVEIARTGAGPAAQTPSIGCSLKWRDA